MRERELGAGGGRKCGVQHYLSKHTTWNNNEVTHLPFTTDQGYDAAFVPLMHLHQLHPNLIPNLLHACTYLACMCVWVSGWKTFSFLQELWQYFKLHFFLCLLQTAGNKQLQLIIRKKITNMASGKFSPPRLLLFRVALLSLTCATEWLEYCSLKLWPLF